MDDYMIQRAVNYLVKYIKIKNDPVKYAISLGVKIGVDCKILCMESGTFGSEPYLVQLGDRVEITYGVRFITHDGGVWVCRKDHPKIDKVAPIIVGSNVFIGTNCVILPGVTIGDNVVIGAGSVVSRNIPSNIVAAGVPARPIKTIEEYKKISIKNSLDTHLMSNENKKKYLLEYFKM